MTPVLEIFSSRNSRTSIFLRSVFLFLVCSLVCAYSVRAEIVLAPLFRDHAVLQREKPVPIWGKAEAGEKIIVSFHGQSAETQASADGKWLVYLQPMPAFSVGEDLIVKSSQVFVVHDVVVGEVWLCSGQSNMEMMVKNTSAAPDAINKANYPLIRQIKVPRNPSEVSLETIDAKSTWLLSTPENVGDFTAVGYFFAAEIHKTLGVPIGLINSSFGGTPVEAWMSPESLASNPVFAVVFERWKQTVAEYPEKVRKHEQQLVAWNKKEALAKKKGAGEYASFMRDTKKPDLRPLPRQSSPAALFNGMIQPLIPYAIRGILWYQGEGNSTRASEYHELFSTMIRDWRVRFNQGELPFFWANLANFKNPPDKTGLNYAFLREAQTKTLVLPNTAQALAIDIGNPDDIHPKNKLDLGHRFALIARAREYGEKLEYVGPTLSGAVVEGAAMRLTFDHADSGLSTKEGEVHSLEVSGADRKFYPAKGVIAGSTLLVSAPEVLKPVAVRYAWRNNPVANLYSSDGLPAVPFRTDTW